MGFSSTSTNTNDIISVVSELDEKYIKKYLKDQ